VNFIRYYHTLKHLKPIQIRYQLWYRIRSKIGFKFPDSDVKTLVSQRLKFSQWIDKPISFSNKEFTFLNQSQKFRKDEIDWNFNKYGKLWAYNLNYMDYLLQSDLSTKQGTDLIELFIKQIKDNSTGKEPYPISLRGINWIKFLSKNKIDNSIINNSLFNQYQILINSLEYHLLGNHLLENGFSLLFGGFFFNNDNLYKKAKQILEKELKEQILEDGGHFELSPMYHQIILERILDLINLIQNNKQFDNQNELLKFLENKASAMLSWLDKMTFSNGDIPHFNDSTFGIASSKQLFDYAQRLNLPVRHSLGEGGNLKINLNLSTSGYRKFKTNNYECIVDVGQLGPDYIPGHAHADMLNFVLYIDNKPIIIDTGISTYEKNDQRQLERSTSSHNTVVVNGNNQSDVWGGFRVGKRAKINLLKDDASVIVAEHNGYKPVIHKRSYDFMTSRFVIKDELSNSKQNATTYFHFHPERKVELNANTIIVDDKYTIVFKSNKDINLEYYNCPLGYNKFSKAIRCKVTFESNMETQIHI
jgi:hypothetical protein